MKTNTTTEALQLRADKLFIELLAIKFNRFEGDLYPRITRADVDKARALAALYDLGVRVSPEARRSYRLASHATVLGTLASAIRGEFSPDDRLSPLRPTPGIRDLQGTARSAQFARWEESLKFLRVMNCPLPAMGVISNPFMQVGLDPLPPELANFNVELLAPREPLDWDYFFALELANMRDECVGTEKLLHAGNTFQYFRNLADISFPDKWYKPIATNLTGVTGALIGPALKITPMLQGNLETEKEFQKYAEAYKNHKLTPETVASAYMLQMQNEQLRARLDAANLELRRGAAIPAPDKIGPDSYFFDPISQGPYTLKQKSESAGVVCVTVFRPNGMRMIVSTNGETKQMIVDEEVYIILLPANHPGLANVPK